MPVSRRKVLRVVAIVVAVLLALPVVALGAITLVSMQRQHRTYDIPAANLSLEGSGALLAEGARLWQARGCGECHGMAGEGRVLMDAMPVARVVPTNISNLPADYTVDDFERVLRHGVLRSGKPAIFMPAHEFVRMPDSEVVALYAHMRTLTAAPNDLPNSSIGPVGRALHVFGLMHLFPAEIADHDAPPAPDPAPTAEYGAALAMGCTGCHGGNYSGGPIPGAPVEITGIPANITLHATGIGGWTYEQFDTVLRRGVRPDGRELDPAKMPWGVYQAMTDTESQAIWAYLQTVEPREFGGR